MNEKEIKVISIICISLIVAGWIFAVTFGLISNNNKIKKLEKQVESLETRTIELEQAFREQDDDFGSFISDYLKTIKELEQRISELESTTNSEIDFNKFLYGVGKVIAKSSVKDYFIYVIGINGETAIIESKNVFSIDEEVLIIEYEDYKYVLVDLS